MKKQIEDEIKRLKNESELMSIDYELSLLDADGWIRKRNIIIGKIEALEWCLKLIK